MNFAKNPRFVSGAFGVALALSLLGGPAFAEAASLTSTQVNAITSLLQAFGVDPGTISNVQAILDGSASTTPSVPPITVPGQGDEHRSATSTCALISNTLRIGSTDQESEGEVSKLQQFLSKDKTIYPEGLVTGYFGHATEEAVKHWQEAHGIVSSGDSASTGFGQVGPATRGELDNEMETECEQGDVPENQSGSENAASSSASMTHGDSRTESDN